MTNYKGEPGKRVTVFFNVKDLKAIEAEIRRREREQGRKVTVSEALRELVREQWHPKPAGFSS